jgi:hypothetical protein
MLALLAVLGWAPEIVDRIVVTVGRYAITESAVVEQIRVAAFLNKEPLDLGGASRRRAAERLVENALVRREMELSRFTPPTEAEVGVLLAKVRAEQFPDDKAYRKALTAAGLREADLKRSLEAQLLLVRFIDFRFKPGVTIAETESEAFYRERFVPDWKRRHGDRAVPELDEVRDSIEEELSEAKVDVLVDDWLKAARVQYSIRFREEAFR